MAAHDIVPTIDVSAVNDDQLAAIDRACQDHGFFLLSGHGLDELITATWEQARRFFDSDRSVKVGVMRDATNPLGYFDRELTKRRRDHKEVFDFADPVAPRSAERNRWPDQLDGFQQSMIDFYNAFSELAMTTTDLVHRSLGLDPATLSSYRGDRTRSAVRLNHYPVGDPVPIDERDGLQELGDTALGYHTDPGVLTLLLQDETGGLQAQAADGSWVDIEPRPGTVVVNMADAVQVWTNDRYRAAVHRVVPMTTRDRMSIPYFLNPIPDAVIQPIAELAGDTPAYESFAWSSYMRARTEDNFADLGVADAQISDYRVSIDS